MNKIKIQLESDDKNEIMMSINATRAFGVLYELCNMSDTSYSSYVNSFKAENKGYSPKLDHRFINYCVREMMEENGITLDWYI